MRIWSLATPMPRLFMVLILATISLLAGCGQKGDLMLPGPDTPSAIAETTPGNEDNEQDGETSDEQ